jgi:L-amino acid N-acyltransferase
MAIGGSQWSRGYQRGRLCRALPSVPENRFGSLDTRAWPTRVVELTIVPASMNLIPCDASFADQILAIFNDAILHSTALYDYEPRSLDSMTAWFENKQRGKFPVMGVVADSGELLGFGSYGMFRAWPAYKYSVEHSIYVAAKHRGRGLGKLLLQEIISSARQQDYHVLIGAIDSQNAASIQLHKRFGFQHAGTIRQVGFKFGSWLDLDLYQLMLETPARPVDG